MMVEKDIAQLDWMALEARVDELIRTIERLANENKALHAQQSDWMTERAALIERTELAKSRIEAIITRLKSMETRS